MTDNRDDWDDFELPDWPLSARVLTAFLAVGATVCIALAAALIAVTRWALS